MTRPKILLIDDAKPARFPADIDGVALDPADETFGTDLTSNLGEADLILLDQNLHRDQVLGLGALDGSSLVGNLRSWARQNELTLPPIVIFTSEDEAFAEEISTVGPAVPLGGSFIGRETHIASALDVEWLIAKHDSHAEQQVASLAADSLKLRLIAGDERMSLQEIGDFLALPRNLPWSSIAEAQLSKWRPPVSEADGAPVGSRGPTPALRWLLQRVLPCPGLLLSDLYASWSLGIEATDIETVLARYDKHDWVRLLVQTQYDGAARNLVGRRWWAAGVDFVGWKLRSRADELGNMQAAIDDLAGPGLRALSSEDLVVVVDADLKESGLAAMKDAIQIQPPGWPNQASDPWMRKEEIASDPISRTMVDPAELAEMA